MTKFGHGGCVLGSDASWVYMVVNASLRSYIIRQDQLRIFTPKYCHNPIFTPGIFSGVGAQNGTARTRPDQPNRDPSFQNDPRMLPRAPLPKFEEV